MHQKDSYDLIVLGAGPGGVTAATRARQRGMKVALLNEGTFLGHSLEGAFKSKALYDLSKIHFAFHRHTRQLKPLFDFFETYLHNQRSAESLRQLEARKLQELGVEYIQGRGQFVSAHEVGVDRRLLRGDHVLIATGSSPRILSGIQPAKQQILTFNDIVNISRPLRSLVVLGAGVVGCEFAAIFAALGTEVTLIESKPRLFSNEDADVGHLLAHCMEDLGVEVLTGTHCSGMLAQEDGVVTMLHNAPNVTTDAALLSVGRVANSAGLNLMAAGVDVDALGFVKTDGSMQTNVPHIYAVGDVATHKGKRMLRLVRVAESEAEVAIAKIFGEMPKLLTHHIPYTVFTHPTIAGAGLGEEEARQLFGPDIRVGKWPHIRNHRSHMMPSQKGFTKLITGPLDNDQILGVRVIGEGAEAIVAEVSMMMQYSLPFSHLLQAPRAYPSFTESLRGAARVIAKLEPPSTQNEEFAYEVSDLDF